MPKTLQDSETLDLALITRDICSILTSISDLGRKPGLAITGEQSSLGNEELGSFLSKVIISKVINNMFTGPRDIEHIVEPADINK